MKPSRCWGPALLTVIAAACWSAPAGAAQPEELLAAYAKRAGITPSPERGQRFFNEKRDGLFPSCAACHGEVPTKEGKDLLAEKPMAALAPAFNPQRFTDPKKVEYRFRMNCLDMVGRECTAAEKADVMSWLLSLKP